MAFIKHAVLIGFVALNGSFAEAQESGGKTVYLTGKSSKALVESSTLSVSDEVTDNCWTNSASIKSKTYLLFEQNGLFVPDYEIAFYSHQNVSTTISAFGFRTNSGLCVVSAEFLVQARIDLTLGGFLGKKEFSFPYVAKLFSRSSVFSSGGNSNDQLSDFFEGAAAEFAANVISGKRSSEFKGYREIYPTSGEPPMSKKEWEKFLKSLENN